MTISVVLTCYNQEKYIEETILSVVTQTYKNWELLIGDDSPNNKCRDIITKYVKKFPDKIHAWHHNPNKGIVNNMKFLLGQRNEESEYIVFLEGDDCLYPKYIEKKLDIFNNNEKIKLIYNEVSTFDENGKIINGKQLSQYNPIFCKKGKISYDNLISKIHYISWSSLMIRGEILREYSIEPKFLGNSTIISDIYFFNQIANNEDIYGIEEPLIYYRKHKKSVTNDIDGILKYYFELNMYYKYLFNEGYISKKVYMKQINRGYLLISTISLKRCFSLGIRSTIKIFLTELFHSIKNKMNN